MTTSARSVVKPLAILRDRYARETVERLACDPVRDANRSQAQLDDSSPRDCRPEIAYPICALTHAFHRQYNFDNDAFDRLGGMKPHYGDR
jgi:hypothetical protein